MSLLQAAKQALEALEELHYSSGTVVAAKMYESATSALRQAIAQAESQEPVADNFVGIVTCESLDGVVKWKGWIPREGTKLYTAPQQPKAEQQEPVALNIASQCRATATSEIAQNILVDAGSGTLQELLLDAAIALENTTPQHREWVEPSDSEIEAVLPTSYTGDYDHAVARAVLKLAKELNNGAA